CLPKPWLVPVNLASQAKKEAGNSIIVATDGCGFKRLQLLGKLFRQRASFRLKHTIKPRRAHIRALLPALVVHLLTRAYAGDIDDQVLLGLQTRKLDQFSSEITDLYGISRIEHI